MSIDTSDQTPASVPDKADKAEGPVHRHLGLALILISAAQLMVVLDGTIVNIALPAINKDLSFGTNLTWVVTGYAIAFGGLLLLGGRVGDLLGRRKVFVTGVLVFALASLLGGIAQNDWQLLAARALQGAGAAMASPTALALITTTFPAGKARNRAFAVYAAMSGAGAAVGLILGGALTEVSWRWTMLINVPIGLLVAFLAPRFLTESKPQPGKWDIPGAATVTLGLVGIVYGFSHKGQVADVKTGTLNTWTDFWTVGPLVAGVALLALFFLIEARSPHALLPLRIVTNRTRLVSFTVMLIVGASMFSLFYFLSLFIQNVLGFSAIKAGVAFLPFSAGIVIAAQISSVLVARVDPRWIAGTGAVLGGISAWGFSQLETTSSYAGGLLPWILVQSVAMGLIFVPLTLTAVSGVAKEDAGVGSAVLNTVQQIGGALGIAVLGTVFANSAADKAAQIAATGDPSQLATIQNVAQVAGTSDAFFISMFLMIGAALITLIGLSIKAKDLAAEESSPVPVG